MVYGNELRIRKKTISLYPFLDYCRLSAIFISACDQTSTALPAAEPKVNTRSVCESMKITKVMKGILSAVCLLVVLSWPLPAGAQIKEFITEAAYYMGEGETVEVARERALVAAKQRANTQISVFLTD